MPIRFSLRTASTLALALVAGTLAGQAPARADDAVTRYSAELRWEAFPNPTGAGSRELASLVWYPGRSGIGRGFATPPARGFPVIVFLHGRGGPALVYSALARRLAERGYVVVLSDTALTDPELQIADGRALLAALAVADTEAGSFFRGKLDLDAVGLAGHSMGGGSTAHILAANPGYRAGFAFAPWRGERDFAASGPTIDVPFGIVHGQGDRTLPWDRTGKVLFDALPPAADGFLYLASRDMTHQNLAVLLPLARAETREVFEGAASLCAAFFDKHLRGDGDALANRLRADNGDPRLVRIFRAAAGSAR